MSCVNLVSSGLQTFRFAPKLWVLALTDESEQHAVAQQRAEDDDDHDGPGFSEQLQESPTLLPRQQPRALRAHVARCSDLPQQLGFCENPCFWAKILLSRQMQVEVCILVSLHVIIAHSIESSEVVLSDVKWSQNNTAYFQLRNSVRWVCCPFVFQSV